MAEFPVNSLPTMETVEGLQNPSEIPPKRIKIEETLEEDRISLLPDCLLVEILVQLPSTDDAIRTGTLSKRWRSLWTSIPVLVFIQTYDDRRTSDFVSFVTKTLTQCRRSKLKKFELNMRYDIQFESQVNNWIRYAVSCDVEELDLTLLTSDSEAEFILHEQFFVNPCFTNLSLGGCIFNPDGAISWKMLRRLSIWDANLDEDLIENILSGCPVLETLELDFCFGYNRLDITSKSVKNLLFYGYMDPNDESDELADVIEINAPNVLSLEIEDDLLLWKLLLLDVSSLVTANLDYTKGGHWETSREEAEEEMLKGFIERLRHVKELKIGVFCYKVFLRLEAKGFTFPSNIKLPFLTSPLYSDSDSVDDLLEGGHWVDPLG